MARSLWKGSLSFGLVSIPIELHTAVRDHRPKFRMLHAQDKALRELGYELHNRPDWVRVPLAGLHKLIRCDW